jgi:hypothetical protein
MRKHLDPWTIGVIVVTLVLFVVSLLVTGFTHDLLLEAGVFLVSVKLIVGAYKSSVATADLKDRLDEIHTVVCRLDAKDRT